MATARAQEVRGRERDGGKGGRREWEGVPGKPEKARKEWVPCVWDSVQHSGLGNVLRCPGEGVGEARDQGGAEVSPMRTGILERPGQLHPVHQCGSPDPPT